jgi:transcriptional regulator CtsR
MGIIQIMKTKMSEWKERINILNQQIQYWIDNKTNKTIEIIQLFYDN